MNTFKCEWKNVADCQYYKIYLQTHVNNKKSFCRHHTKIILIFFSVCMLFKGNHKHNEGLIKRVYIIDKSSTHSTTQYWSQRVLHANALNNRPTPATQLTKWYNTHRVQLQVQFRSYMLTSVSKVTIERNNPKMYSTTGGGGSGGSISNYISKN